MLHAAINFCCMLLRLAVGILAAASSPIAAVWLYLTIRGLNPNWNHVTASAGIVILEAVVGFTGVALLTVAAVRGALYARSADRRWLRWCGSAWLGALAVLVLWLIVAYEYAGI